MNQDLRKILSREGATFHEDLDEQRPFAVTHMIMTNMAADNFQKAISFIKKYPDLPLKFVKPSWVYDSVSSKERLSEDMDEYSFVLLDTNITMTNDSSSEILSFFIPKNFFQDCVFYFYQYDQILFSSKDPSNSAPIHAVTASPPHSPLFSSLLLNSTNTQHPIFSIIQQGKGKIISEYDEQLVTHIILPTQCNILTIRKNKKPIMATLFWLADAIRQCDPYMHLCHPLHFPRPSYGPIENGSVDISKTSITGYSGRDRQAIQAMLVLAGASFTGYFTNKHSVLIASSPSGEKYERAISWGIPVVNRIWIEDSYRQWNWQSLNDARYQITPTMDIKQPQEEKENIPNIIIDRFSDKDIPKQNKRTSQSKEVSKKSKSNPDDEQITLSGHGPSKPFVDNTIIIGYTGCRVSEEDIMSLSSMRKCRTSTNIEECTHLLANRIQRTEKFLKAIPLGLHIINPNWLQDSIAVGRFLDESLYLVKDSEMEEKYHFKLKDAMESAKRKKLFESYIFQISPGTNPQEHVLSGILRACGAQVLEFEKKKNPNIIKIVQSNEKKLDNVLDVESLLTSVLTQTFSFK